MAAPKHEQEDEAVRQLHGIYDRSDRVHMHDPGTLPEGLDALADILSDEAFVKWANGGHKVCSHLRRAAIQPCFVFFYSPDVALCAKCAFVRDLSIKGTPEDTTCDCCKVCDPEVEYYPLGTVRGYVSFQGGICSKCHDRRVQ